MDINFFNLITPYNIIIHKEVATKIENKVDGLITTGSNFNDLFYKSKYVSNVGDHVSKLMNMSDYLKNITDTWFKGGKNNNFLSDFYLQVY